jgi:hypothetical protein
VVEIGTASGMSALAMLSVLPPASRLVSFDASPGTIAVLMPGEARPCFGGATSATDA